MSKIVGLALAICLAFAAGHMLAWHTFSGNVVHQYASSYLELLEAFEEARSTCAQPPEDDEIAIPGRPNVNNVARRHKAVI
jgi:hypothetical protein